MSEEIEAGRTLDARVAELVMGWTRYPEPMHPTDNRTIGGVLYCPPGCPYNAGEANVVPYYSTNISDAWEVAEKMRGGGWVVRVQEMPDRTPFLSGSGWRPEENQPINRRAACWLYPTPEFTAQMVGRYLYTITELGDSAPLAICKAALQAVEACTRRF